MFAIWLTTEKYFEILKKEEEEDLNICSVCVLFIISNKWFHKKFLWGVNTWYLPQLKVKTKDT